MVDRNSIFYYPATYDVYYDPPRGPVSQLLIIMARSVKDFFKPPANEVLQTRAELALTYRQFALARHALSHITQFDDCRRSMYVAIGQDDTKTISLLVRKTNVDINQYNRGILSLSTFLYSAVDDGKVRAVKTLLRLGANPHLPMYDHRDGLQTPLQRAERIGNTELVGILKKAIANTPPVPDSGSIPPSLARAIAHMDLDLLQRGIETKGAAIPGLDDARRMSPPPLPALDGSFNAKAPPPAKPAEGSPDRTPEPQRRKQEKQGIALQGRNT